MRTRLNQLKAWAGGLRTEVLALWIAARSPLTPRLAKIVAGAVAAYALSPIDLIPDFIPVLGYLDDLLIVPLGIGWAVRLIPARLMDMFRAEAKAGMTRPDGKRAATVIVAVWLAALISLGWWWSS